jgi:hypothetical protein
MSLPIDPETRLGALLEAYPGVEGTLLATAPALAELKNPVLRQTVAQFATLEQAAAMGSIPVKELVRRLREAAGQSAPLELPVLGASVNGSSAEPAPAWVNEELVRHEIDADRMLARGEHPIGPIRQWFAALEPGQIIRLTSSFRPAPLIETLRRDGASVYAEERGPGAHVIYIAKF